MNPEESIGMSPASNFRTHAVRLKSDTQAPIARRIFRPGLRALTITVLVGFGVSLAPAVARGDRIILRNFEVLNDVQVESFDPDAVKLVGGKSLTWDEIEAGTVAGDKQAEFNKLLKQLGDPLFRIRQRLSIGDYRGQLEFAERLEAIYATRNSDPAYWVALGLMWGRLAEGRREASLQPYLRCMEIRRARADSPPQAPGDRRLQIDPQTGLCGDLEPIWFDAEAAKKQLPAVSAAVGQVKKPWPPAVRLYYASMAITAGENERAANALREPMSGKAEQLRNILLAQLKLSVGDRNGAEGALLGLLPTLTPATRPLARYWLGVVRSGAETADARQLGLLDLLRLPAVHGEQHPELAAAGLAHAMQVLDKQGDASGAVRVRRELLQRYRQTYHASLQIKTAPSTTEEKR